MKKKFEMELLNSEMLKNIQGGIGNCDSKGDTIICGFGMNVILCATFEASCPVSFTSDCTAIKKFNVSCTRNFIIKPITIKYY